MFLNLNLGILGIFWRAQRENVLIVSSFFNRILFTLFLTRKNHFSVPDEKFLKSENRNYRIFFPKKQIPMPAPD